MAAIVFTDGSATIGTTEWSLMSNSSSLATTATKGTASAVINLSAMAAGDQFQISIYEKVNGVTQALLWRGVVTGVQAELFVTPAVLLGGGWDYSLKKLAGTDRAINWSVRQDSSENATVSIGTGGIVAASFAAGAVDSSALAASAVTKIWQYVIEGSNTAEQYVRGFASALLAKASGFATTTRTFRDVPDTKDRIVATVDATGRPAVTLTLT